MKKPQIKLLREIPLQYIVKNYKIILQTDNQLVITRILLNKKIEN